MTPSPSHKPVAAVPHTLKNIVKQEKNVIHMANGCPIILNTSYPLNEFVTECLPEQSNMNTNKPNWDLTTYENRLKTFNFQEWKLDFITPSQMANAGLYFLGRQDRVRCVFCSKEFDYWQRGDDPLVEHKRKSPHCAFFKQNQGYDVCGLYSSLPTNSNHPLVGNDYRKIEHFLDAIGVVHKIDPPEHIEFSSFETRLKTFDTCKRKMKQDTHTLVEAGFFYIGNGQDDQMLCFCCSQGLKDWEDDDEPWTEHARWSPTCTYVLLSKGKDFVDKACGVKKDVANIKQEELSKLNADHKDSCVVENDIKVNSTKRKHDDIQDVDNCHHMLPIPDKVLGSQQKDTNSMPDSILCKICYKEKIKVAFVPCGHVISCVQCALTLDSCAVCRQPYNFAMRVYVHMDETKVKTKEEIKEEINEEIKEEIKDEIKEEIRDETQDETNNKSNDKTKDDEIKDDQLPCSSSQCSYQSSDSMLCNVCHKEEMDVAFIPCRHIYSCVKCAADLHECPVCTDAFCGTMQIFL